MIIKGELGEYNVSWVTDVVDRCYVCIYKGPVKIKKWFGLLEVQAEPVYTTYAVEAARYGTYDVKRMLPNEMEAWFKKAVREYERFHKAWNQ